MIEPSIWHQGERLEGEAAASLSRRSHLYGDSLFETMVADANGIHFWELHYFRLMASMRIMRMSIPQAWSPDALADELLACVDTAMPCRLRLAVWRQGGLGYMPSESTIEWAMHVDPLENGPYPLPVKRIELGMFQDHLKAKGLLSNV
ncbi:MAG: aminotransferase class IV, partial [Schleiferiaceae bacterium]|nr:aminotransferase class IV [Schleiferiaceae bacterium]